jgi:hypothetical protein
MGQNFRVFVGTAVVSEAVSCDVTIQGNMEDASTKDDSSSYTKEQMTSKQWNVQVNQYQAQYDYLRTLISRFNADSKVTVGWDQTAGAGNQLPQNAAFARSGQAILSDLTITANNRATVEVSCQYQGSGAIA